MPQNLRPLTTRSTLAIGLMAGLTLSTAAGLAQDRPGPAMRFAPLEWREAEKDKLVNHVQLTTDEMFVKAGEAYFNPQGTWIIFQAIPLPDEGEEPQPFYAMYVAKLKMEDGRIIGIEKPIEVSLPGTANTCGFFHPDPGELGHIIFGTTIVPPKASDAPGYTGRSSRYLWSFPRETDVVRLQVNSMRQSNQGVRIREEFTEQSYTKLTTREGYDAECAYSPDGRFIVFCAVQENENAGDLFVLDLKLDKVTPLVQEVGYDGGPFFSPDGKRICYRSDRKGDQALQIFVADLAFDEETGGITGISKEHQATENDHVNWCPFWHPDGRHILYSTSAMGHFNYEVFIIDSTPGHYGENPQRVTEANGFDGLPVFDSTGKYMMWTSQRVEDPRMKGESHIWLAEFVMDLDDNGEGDEASPTTKPEGG